MNLKAEESCLLPDEICFFSFAYPDAIGVKFNYGMGEIRCNERFDESTLGKVSLVPLMHLDPSDLGSMIHFRVFSKKRILSRLFSLLRVLFVTAFALNIVCILD